ncbi:hypothetical protein [Sinimarinibacterium thermocellulolyticum]|uniref:Fenitrothion hydrolase FedB n=1 Tax=Sinimarinibacterium thermocellulolyticum TaxID=3170016 RepID=A0ABV2AAM6_9GAMM
MARSARALAQDRSRRRDVGTACRSGAAIFALLALSAQVPSAAAHSFGRIYNLPVPFWMYAWGGAAALLLSFLVVAWFATAPAGSRAPRSIDLQHSGVVRALRWLRLRCVLRALALIGLIACVLSGWFGTRDPYRNFNMTFFWVVFVLGFAYLTALIGDVYALLNPWRTLAELLGRAWRGYLQGRVRYPSSLAYWPALALYMAFIWVELFAHTRPLSLAQLLLGYSVLNLVAVYVFGAAAWFRYGEFFAVFLRLLALMAPIDYRPGQGIRLRPPFSGLLEAHAESWSLLVFILFMLSSTAFDGLRATVPWFKLFWFDPTGWLTEWMGKPPIHAYIELRPWYLVYETMCLFLSPLLYLAIYLVFVWLARVCGGSRRSLRELALGFAYSLLPIALVYHFTHYYTLLLTQGLKIVSLLSDPLGNGWNLFGTAGLLRAPILPDLKWIWHTQVGLIVFGHIVSVWIAHVEALRLFPSRRAAVLSQIPMLLLMVAFTTFGLWILAQPIQSGR